MDDDRRTFGLKHCMLWVLLTMVGYAFGFLIGFFLAHFILGEIMIGVGVVAGVGMMQWLILRRFIRSSSSWVLVSVVGLTVSLSLKSIASVIWQLPGDLDWATGAIYWLLALLLGGFIIGVSQHWILQKHVRHSRWWMLVSAAGWGMSVFGLTIRPDMSDQIQSVILVILGNGMLSPAIAGLILGIVTGISLLLMLKHPEKKEVPDTKRFRHFMFVCIGIILISWITFLLLASAKSKTSFIIHPRDGSQIHAEFTVEGHFSKEAGEQPLWVILKSVELDKYVPVDIEKNKNQIFFGGTDLDLVFPGVNTREYVLYMVSATASSDSMLWHDIGVADEAGAIHIMDGFPQDLTVLDSVRITRE